LTSHRAAFVHALAWLRRAKEKSVSSRSLMYCARIGRLLQRKWRRRAER